MSEPGNIEGGRPWSAMELGDLERGLRIGVSLEIIADFLRRGAEEVQQKADELGILPSWKRLPAKSAACPTRSQDLAIGGPAQAPESQAHNERNSAPEALSDQAIS